MFKGDKYIPGVELIGLLHPLRQHLLLLVVQWPSAVLGQRFRGHIYCAALCELVLCQSNAPEVIYIVLCSVVL